MSGLPDQTVDYLRAVLEIPDLSETRYRLVEELGRGGMGIVYLAEDTVLNREVALKVLHASGEDAGVGLLREARILAGLEHPGLVPVHDAGTLPDGRDYYAMKLVRGARLDQHARLQPAMPELLRLFMRICEAVAFAHGHGVIHRDLKPQNVMVGPFGEVLVLDWGVAQTPHPPVAESPAIMGTRGYMAPEQASGLAGPLDNRADIFSLGKILEFLIAGLRPSRQLRAIASKATSPDKALRYADALDLSNDVGRFLDGQPVEAYREAFWEKAARWLVHNKTLTILLATYVIVRAIILFFARR